MKNLETPGKTGKVGRSARSQCLRDIQNGGSEKVSSTKRHFEWAKIVGMRVAGG